MIIFVIFVVFKFNIFDMKVEILKPVYPCIHRSIYAENLETLNRIVAVAIDYSYESFCEIASPHAVHQRHDMFLDIAPFCHRREEIFDDEKLGRYFYIYQYGGREMEPILKIYIDAGRRSSEKD